MSTSSKTVDGITFGPFFLDTAGRRLLRDGRRVAISPIELKLLETLLRNRNRVLTGDELRVLVWADDPSAGVAPAQDVNALYVAIRKLRKTLGTYGRWIVNIPKVGYTVSEEVKVDMGDEEIHVTADDGQPFIGRQAELDRLKDMLGRTRLVTLTGPPGIGKSRLASVLASIVAANYPDGIFSVNLVPIESEALVPSAVLRTIGLTEQADRSVTEVITDHLRDKRSLLVLDNCEHLIEACSQLVDHLLRAAPKLQILVASQEPLLLSGESVMQVPPLSVPDPASGPNGSHEYEAVKLFTALAKQHGFDLATEKKDAAMIGELCRRLDGIPLAIELAAVQVGAYTIEQIIEVMSDRFRLLRRRGGQDVRHKTLEDAVDWSYSLLSEEERIFLRRLSVFTGGWTSETAREICTGDGVETGDTLHLLAQLVRRSLIQLSGVRGNHRYQMLETIRQFGRERLREAGEEKRILARLDQYFVELAEKYFEASVQSDWLAQLKAEYDNIRSVLERSIRRGGNSETGLRLCGALAKFWFNYGYLREARWWSKLALAGDDGKFPEASARALRTAGFFFGQTSDSAEDSQLGKAYFEQSLAIWRDLGNENEEAFTLSHYSYLLNSLGLADEARQAANRSLEICTKAGDHANIARSMNNIAVNLLDSGKAAEAKPIFESALAEARIADDRYLEAVCLHNLGEVAVQMGELENADVNLAYSVEIFRAIGNRPLFGRTLLLQGEIASLKNETDTAIELSKKALEEFRDIEDSEGIASALEVIACTHARTGDPELFLTLNSAAAQIRRKIKLQSGPARKALIDDLVQSAAKAVGKKATQSAIDRGTKLSLSEAVESALN